MSRAVEKVYIDQDVARYIVALVQATRTDSHIAVGASPRASLALLKLSRARATIEGRNFVIPDDVKFIVRGSIHSPALAQTGHVGHGHGGEGSGGDHCSQRSGPKGEIKMTGAWSLVCLLSLVLLLTGLLFRDTAMLAMTLPYLLFSLYPFWRGLPKTEWKADRHIEPDHVWADQTCQMALSLTNTGKGLEEA